MAGTVKRRSVPGIRAPKRNIAARIGNPYLTTGTDHAQWGDRWRNYCRAAGRWDLITPSLVADSLSTIGDADLYTQQHLDTERYGHLYQYADRDIYADIHANIYQYADRDTDANAKLHTDLYIDAQ